VTKATALINRGNDGSYLSCNAGVSVDVFSGGSSSMASNAPRTWNLRDLAAARSWAFHFVLTLSALVLTISGADDWHTAGILVGSGLCLDILRWVLHAGRGPVDILAELNSLAQKNARLTQPYVNRWKLILYPMMLAFIVVSLVFYLYAPLPPAANIAAGDADHGQGWILHISKLCRVFVKELSARGYKTRAAAFQIFFEITFCQFIFMTIVGCFAATRSLTFEMVCRTYDRDRRGLPCAASYGRAVALFAFAVTLGFFGLNNLDDTVWNDPGASAYHSNLFIIICSVMMSFVSLSIVAFHSYSTLYGADFSVSKIRMPMEESND
jgi:hypothetical protein